MLTTLGEEALANAGFSVIRGRTAINVPETMKYHQSKSQRRQTITIQGIITSQNGHEMLKLQEVTNANDKPVSMTVPDRVSFNRVVISQPVGGIIAPTQSHYEIKDNRTDEIIGIAPTDSDRTGINNALTGTDNIRRRFVLAFANSGSLIKLLRKYSSNSKILDISTQILEKEELVGDAQDDEPTVHVDNAVPIIMAMLII